jgi:hypothetical protein
MIPLAKIPRPLHPSSMRTSRLLGEGRSFYHVKEILSRVVDRRRVFEAKDKEIFRRLGTSGGLRDRQSIRFCLPKSPARLILLP